MPEIPKAHRRLVPRVPKKEPEPPKSDYLDDLELTAERVIHKTDDSMELERTSIRTRIAGPEGSEPLDPLEALEALEGLDALDATTNRSVPADEFDSIAPTGEPPRYADELAPIPGPPEYIDELAPTPDPSLYRRAKAARLEPEPEPEPDEDDDRDAGETFALPSRVRTEPPEEPARALLRPPGFVLPAPPGPDAMTFARASKHAVKFALASQPDVEARVPQVDTHELRAMDPNAFADLEPTSLKTPMARPDVEERPTTHISPAERGLLAAMSEGHEASRMVYMNWLERRGEKQRAEFLRLEQSLAAMSPVDIRHQETQDRLRELAQKISVDWRSRVSRSLIEGCTYQAGCPGYWRALPADADDVRNCATCAEQVFYCVTIDLARGRIHAGQRVAIDITVERRNDDLELHCAGCGSKMPIGTRFCPHCGRSTMY